MCDWFTAWNPKLKTALFPDRNSTSKFPHIPDKLRGSAELSSIMIKRQQTDILQQLLFVNQFYDHSMKYVYDLSSWLILCMI